MARIPTVSMSEVPATPSPGGNLQPSQLARGRELQASPRRVSLVEGVRLDAGAVNARNVGRGAIGQAISEVGDMMLNLALRSRNLDDKGKLADEETRRMNVAGGIQKYMTENPDKPETWGQVRKAAWDSYDKERAVRQKKEGWRNKLVAADDRSYADYRTRIDTTYGIDESKGLMRKANAKIMANGEMKLRSGDYNGFVTAIESMNLFPDQKEETIRRGLEEGMYKTANNELDGLHDIPPGQVVPFYKQFLVELNMKDEKTGRFSKYEFEQGGLSLGGRVNLESMANARIREAERAMDTAGKQIVTAIRAGRATEADVSAALKTGAIDRQTAAAISPDVALAEEVAADRINRRKEVAQAKAENEAQQMAAATDSLRKRAVEKGDVSIMDIDKQLALGKVNREQADQLKAELIQTARREQTTAAGAFEVLSKEIHGGFASKLFGRQPSEEQYRKLQMSINNAALTKESRLKLVGDLMDLKLADMADLQEEGPKNGKWLDRDITAPERDMRKTMIGEYKKLLPALGDTLAGDLMFNQEARIRAFFDTAPAKDGRPRSEIDKFVKEELLPEAQRAAGHEALKDAFGF